MALGGVVQHALEPVEPVLIGVDQGIVQNKQSRGSRLLQQVGIGEAAYQPELLARAETLFLVVPGIAAFRSDQTTR